MDLKNVKPGEKVVVYSSLCRGAWEVKSVGENGIELDNGAVIHFRDGRTDMFSMGGYICAIDEDRNIVEPWTQEWQDEQNRETERIQNINYVCDSVEDLSDDDLRTFVNIMKAAPDKEVKVKTQYKERYSLGGDIEGVLQTYVDKDGVDATFATFEQALTYLQIINQKGETMIFRNDGDKLLQAPVKIYKIITYIVEQGGGTK